MITYKINVPKGRECIIGQGNFSLKTTDDIVHVVISSVKDVKVGVGMNDGGVGLTRLSGNDSELAKAAAETVHAIGAGHAFVVFVEGAFPINLINDISDVHGVCRIYAASANPLEVLIEETELGRAIIGVVDGIAARDIEDDAGVRERRDLIRKFGYRMD